MILLLKNKFLAYGLLLACFLAFLPSQGEAANSEEEIAAVFYHGHGHRYHHRYRGRDRFYGYNRAYYGYPNYYYDDDSYYNERPYYDQGYGIDFRIR